MICPKLKLIFLHPPKTAGTAVTLTLLSIESPKSKIQKRYPYVNREARRHYLINQNNWQHLTLSEIHTLRPETRDWKSFGLIRHPYSRTISEYFYQRRMRTVKSDINESIVSGSLWRTGYPRHDMPQSEYYGPDSYCWQFNELPERWDEICETMGIPKIELLTANRSSPGDTEDLLSDAAKQVIQQKFKSDFTRWKFPV